MRSDQSPSVGRGNPLAVVVSGLSSDAHTWNLVYLQLVLEELGHEVTNLGGCVPDAELVDRCRRMRPDLVVLGTVNGHGFRDGLRVIRALRGSPELVATPIVIGGQLDTAGGGPGRVDQLLTAGFDAVFSERDELRAFRSFVASVALAAKAPEPAASPVGV